MTIFRRTQFMRVPAPGRYARPSEDRPPRPPMSASRVQWGIHERQHDPCGRGPMALAGAKSGAGA